MTLTHQINPASPGSPTSLNLSACHRKAPEDSNKNETTNDNNENCLNGSFNNKRKNVIKRINEPSSCSKEKFRILRILNRQPLLLRPQKQKYCPSASSNGKLQAALPEKRTQTPTTASENYRPENQTTKANQPKNPNP